MLDGGRFLINVEIIMKDEDGNIVENANNRVKVNVSGAGRPIGLDQGERTSSNKSTGLRSRLFRGK